MLVPSLFARIFTACLSPAAPHHSLEGLAMEFLIGSYNLEHNTCWQYLAELLVVFQLQLLHLQVDEVALPDGFCGRLIVARIDMLVIAHLVEQHALLLLHFPIEGEELCSLIWVQASFRGDELFQVGLKACWVELFGPFLRLRLQSHKGHHHNEYQSSNYLFHFHLLSYVT